MWRSVVIAVWAALVMPIVGEAQAAPPEAAKIEKVLKGTWVDEGGTDTVVGKKKGRLAVKKIVDGDGARFQVLKSGWDGDRWSWTYLVPSTGYVVTIWVDAVYDDRFSTSWENDHGYSGTEEVFRK